MADAGTSAAAVAAVVCLHPVLNVGSCSSISATCRLYFKLDMQAGPQYTADKDPML